MENQNKNNLNYHPITNHKHWGLGLLATLSLLVLAGSIMAYSFTNSASAHESANLFDVSSTYPEKGTTFQVDMFVANQTILKEDPVQVAGDQMDVKIPRAQIDGLNQEWNQISYWVGIKDTNSNDRIWYDIQTLHKDYLTGLDPDNYTMRWLPGYYHATSRPYPGDPSGGMGELIPGFENSNDVVILADLSFNGARLTPFPLQPNDPIYYSWSHRFVLGSLAITSPGVGETWNVGESKNISFKLANIAPGFAEVRIQATICYAVESFGCLNPVNFFEDIVREPNDPTKIYSFNWEKVGYNLAGENVYGTPYSWDNGMKIELSVQIGTLPFEAGIFSEDITFTNNPPITMDLPTGSEAWEIGSMQTVSWTLDDSVDLTGESIALQLKHLPSTAISNDEAVPAPTGNLYSGRIDTATHQGTFEWKVGYTYAPSTDTWYLMDAFNPDKLSNLLSDIDLYDFTVFGSLSGATVGSNLHDYSGWFDIVPTTATNSIIIVSNPIASETWILGTPQTIQVSTVTSNVPVSTTAIRLSASFIDYASNPNGTPNDFPIWEGILADAISGVEWIVGDDIDGGHVLRMGTQTGMPVTITAEILDGLYASTFTTSNVSVRKIHFEVTSPVDATQWFVGESNKEIVFKVLNQEFIPSGVVINPTITLWIQGGIPMANPIGTMEITPDQTDYTFIWAEVGKNINNELITSLPSDQVDIGINTSIVYGGTLPENMATISILETSTITINHPLANEIWYIDTSRDIEFTLNKTITEDLVIDVCFMLQSPAVCMDAFPVPRTTISPGATAVAGSYHTITWEQVGYDQNGVLRANDAWKNNSQLNLQVSGGGVGMSGVEDYNTEVFSIEEMGDTLPLSGTYYSANMPITQSIESLTSADISWGFDEGYGIDPNGPVGSGNIIVSMAFIDGSGDYIDLDNTNEPGDFYSIFTNAPIDPAITDISRLNVASNLGDAVAVQFAVVLNTPDWNLTRPYFESLSMSYSSDEMELIYIDFTLPVQTPAGSTPKDITDSILYLYINEGDQVYSFATSVGQFINWNSDINAYSGHTGLLIDQSTNSSPIDQLEPNTTYTVFAKTPQYLSKRANEDITTPSVLNGGETFNITFPELEAGDIGGTDPYSIFGFQGRDDDINSSDISRFSENFGNFNEMFGDLGDFNNDGYINSNDIWPFAKSLENFFLRGDLGEILSPPQ